MGLLSKFKKTKQETPADEGQFTSRAADESTAVRARAKRGTRNSAREDDETLTEKKRARRRLVGAVALVLAVIIGLPMIFDSEPKPLASDIAIQIPAKEKPVAAQPAVQSAVIATPAAQSAATETAPAAAALDAGEEVVEETKAAPAHAEPAKPAKPEAVKPATVAPASKPEPAKKADDSQRAAAILEGKAEPKADAKADVKDAKPAAAGRFMVQVAALATQEKINELRGKLSAAGIKSSTQKVAAQSGELTRVLVGPFASKEEAERMRERLARMGLNGKLVAG